MVKRCSQGCSGLLVVVVASVLLAFFFFTPTITGNAIGILSLENSNLISGAILILTFIGVLLVFRHK